MRMEPMDYVGNTLKPRLTSEELSCKRRMILAKSVKSSGAHL